MDFAFSNSLLFRLSPISIYLFASLHVIPFITNKNKIEMEKIKAREKKRCDCNPA